MQINVLFIIFNKLEETKRVFNAIRSQQPKNLFIAADGARLNKDGEAEKCQYIRNWVLQHIDWECEVRTLFRDQNIGCGRAPSEAISWFFEYVEEGIILEDDCLPHPDFFPFCTELLEKYRNEESISAISGNNFQKSQPMNLPSDYYFSIFPSSWGWATWKRAWQGYKFHIESWRNAPQATILSFIFKEEKYALWWKKQFDWMLKANPEDMWDFQFHYYSMYRRQLAVIPKANLVTNIGHGVHGTHFHDPDSYLSNLPLYELKFPLSHPDIISRNYEADEFVQKLLFGEAETVSSLKKIKRGVKKIIRILK